MNHLVTVSWLADHLNETLVLDATLAPPGSALPVTPRARYEAKHIPGAIFFDIEDLSDHATTLPHMLSPAEAFASKLSALGVDSDRTIVVYEQEGVFSAPRAWWMLRTFSVRKVYVLDGGLSAWVENGLPTESGAVAREPVSFHATLDQEAVKDFAQLQKLISEEAQIVDARSAGRFAGSAPEPRPGISSGHMPGAINIPFTDLIEKGRYKSAEELRKVFSAKGVDLEQPVTTTCGSGVTAAVVGLGLEIAGAESFSLYDGSWAEYALQPDAVIQKD
ncbi:3-mercaptopyruvate sulfurtransferase [Terriglobus saanensis]|uniref:3-mercaptopyruvate sulfurtransferase n=1 Tax=Terriglobus saanensis (strain ATCC BAA-1853 / DSM 23119 / SP1PR4) TaxID=401053 RepID=E8UYU2_TERSS|nr:3-mercaptopyruvate sulfurtransferase [Terriglobus saanensis]ADV84308.1 Rhodanese domain protein [Terriglobus saanensis SP1PR4]